MTIGWEGEDVLDNYFTLFVFSSCPSANLCHELETSFICTQIRKIKKAIGVQYTDQFHIIKIKTFCHHRGPDENIGLICLEVIDYSFHKISLNVLNPYPFLQLLPPGKMFRSHLQSFRYQNLLFPSKNIRMPCMHRVKPMSNRIMAYCRIY